MKTKKNIVYADTDLRAQNKIQINIQLLKTDKCK